MKSSLVLFTSYELILAFIFGLLTLYLSFKVLNNFVLKIDFFRLVGEGNTAVAIFESSLIICILLLVENTILPSVDALRTMVLAGNGLTFQIFSIAFGYFLLFYVIALAFSLLLLTIAFYVFIKATVNVDEMAEIKKNNVAVSLLVSAVMLGMTLFIRPAFDNFMRSLVNYNKLENRIAPAPNLQLTPEEGMELPEQRLNSPR